MGQPGLRTAQSYRQKSNPLAQALLLGEMKGLQAEAASLEDAKESFDAPSEGVACDQRLAIRWSDDNKQLALALDVIRGPDSYRKTQGRFKQQVAITPGQQPLYRRTSRQRVHRETVCRTPR